MNLQKLWDTNKKLIYHRISILLRTRSNFRRNNIFEAMLHEKNTRDFAILTTTFHYMNLDFMDIKIHKLYRNCLDALTDKLRYFFHDFGFAKAALLIGIIFGTFHLFCYWLPFTDNAFIVTNVTPVAANVSGFITNLYVKNGQKVKEGQAIFKVYQPPYTWTYKQSWAEYKEARQHIVVLFKKIQRTQDLYKSVTADLNKTKYELGLKNKQLVAEAISKLEIVKLTYDVSILENKRLSLFHEIAVLQESIKEQRFRVKSLKAKRKLAKINLDLTIVRAPADGVIDNMYVSVNTPIKIHQPVFSFLDTTNYYVQANFNETDLRNVRPGSKAYIILRMYYFNKLYHGVVVNNLWAAERQKTAIRSQIQKVRNENEWLLLPQRFPLQIKITDPDPAYPLHPGASAYVYISTH